MVLVNGSEGIGTGVYELVDETTLRITELPVRKWTQDYKEFLESMMNPTDKNKRAIYQGLSRTQHGHPCEF
ncbi:hypothetical protein GOP47_0008794 [Adiantum capillus-veneris]|uniref:DNA topoisomerase (ATP-hydrolyzing) n=1 Tax=Adiantum capillus-veneris TaxID=13818 RepID=A0A9D4UZ90_ADICA|nr:hypothetical protein GOP47_0008794 [Adiantum capillus-veneris]